MPSYNINDSKILKSDKQLQDYSKNKDGLQWVNKEIDMIEKNFIEKRSGKENEIHETIGLDIIINKQKKESLKNDKVEILRKELENIIESSLDNSLSSEFVDIGNKIKLYKENVAIEKSEVENKTSTLYKAFSEIADKKIVDMFLYPNTFMQWFVKIMVYILSVYFFRILFLLVFAWAFFEIYYKIKSREIEDINRTIDDLSNNNDILRKEISEEILNLEDDIIKYKDNKHMQVKLDKINRNIVYINKKLNGLEKNQDTKLREISSRTYLEKKQKLNKALKKKKYLEDNDIKLRTSYGAIKDNYSDIDRNASIEEILTELRGYLDSGEAIDDNIAIELYKERLKKEKEEALNKIKRQEELKRHQELRKSKQKEVEMKRIKMEQQAKDKRMKLEEERKERERKMKLKEEESKIYKLEECIKELDKRLNNRSINEYEKTDIKEERNYLHQQRLELIKKREKF